MVRPRGLRGRLEARVLEPLAAFQIRHPLGMLAIALVSVGLALFLASKLSLKTSLGELLPENKRSVIVAEQVNQRLPAISTLAVVAEGSDNDALRTFVDEVAPKIRAIGPSVGVVDKGVQETQQFFEDYAFLYADFELVKKVHRRILDRYDYEVHKAAGTLIDEDEEAPPPLTEESIRKQLEEESSSDTQKKVNEAKKQYPGGYYLDEEKHVAVILVRTPINAGDAEQSRELQRKISLVIDEVNPTKLDPTMKVGFGGNLITSAETREQIEADLQHVGVWGISLILGVVFLYYLRIRTLVAMTVTVGIGACWTFGLAYLLIGHLNSSTGFLFSVIVGNGINFGIIYMARYLEARRKHDAAESILTAHRETWLATLTAASAAMCAYGSLAVTDFRGFKHFGIIGGTGMLLCWLATYLFLPSILVLMERVSPIKPATGVVTRYRALFGKPFAFLASRFPRGVTLAAVVLSAAAAVLAFRYVAADPMEYNMRNIDNDPLEHQSDARRLGGIIDPIVGRQGMDGLAIATDELDQVLPLKEELLKRRDEAEEGKKPFRDVVTIHSLIPTQQDDKLALVKDARRVLARAHRKRFMKDEDWKKVDDMFPEARMKTVGIDDLPEQVVRPFTEKDGTRGKLVYVAPTPGRSVWDGRYLIDWAAAIRLVDLGDSKVEGSGRSVIFADMILTVGEDAPKAIIVSLLGTLLIVLLAFRGRRAGFLVMGSVVVGLLWTVAVLALAKSELSPFQIEPLKLNFLNFVAIPITIGVGADYAVNVMQRSQIAGAVNQAVVETGGAVVLCALTTILGYSALTLSINRAVQSFGIVAAAGEICCVISGVLVLPAFLLWRRR